MNLYTKEGWINPDVLIHNSSAVVVAIGGRGIGKTYGCLKMLHDEKIPFIYLRRTQSQIDSISIPALNPYNAIAHDEGITITCKKAGKYTISFHDTVKDDKGQLQDAPEPFAIGAALSTFANIRGLSAERFKVVLFDEIIPERHERPIKSEASAFSNLIESLNRNRELAGLDPLKTVLLTNSNSINSDILQTMGCIPVIDKMVKSGQEYRQIKDGLISIIRYIDSPVSQRKKNTAYYRILENEDFKRMSLDNDFSESDFEYIGNRPLIEYNTLVSISGITVYAHKSDNTYYIIDGEKSRNVYADTELEKKAFRKRYYYLYYAMTERRLVYNTVSCKMIFERLWNK